MFRYFSRTLYAIFVIRSSRTEWSQSCAGRQRLRYAKALFTGLEHPVVISVPRWQLKMMSGWMVLCRRLGGTRRLLLGERIMYVPSSFTF
jgi:hypothetical protein